MLSRFLEHLAERIAAQVATMLTATLQRLHVSHQARQWRQLEELARQYESDGHEDAAAWIRTKNLTASVQTPAAEGAQLLKELGGPANNEIRDPQDGSSALPEPLEEKTKASRRSSRKSRKPHVTRLQCHPLDESPAAEDERQP